MIIYYRLSSHSSNVPRIPWANKLYCLQNFLTVFSNETIFLIQDNFDSTLPNLFHPNIKIESTNLGNSASFLHALTKAINNDIDEQIYFVEDDYLHHPLAAKSLLEGFQIADYVTCYDHPDKYSADYFNGEDTKLIRTKSQHWKYSISTTMTFASTVRILREDFEIWKRYCQDSRPHDHKAFCQLKRKYNRKLAVAISGKSFHNDLSSSDIIFDQWIFDSLVPRQSC